MPKALILGVTGQDGSLLAHFLLGQGYEVVGTSRDAAQARSVNLERLGLLDRVRLETVTTHDFRSVIQRRPPLVPQNRRIPFDTAACHAED